MDELPYVLLITRVHTQIWYGAEDPPNLIEKTRPEIVFSIFRCTINLSARHHLFYLRRHCCSFNYLFYYHGGSNFLIGLRKAPRNVYFWLLFTSVLYTSQLSDHDCFSADRTCLFPWLNPVSFIRRPQVTSCLIVEGVLLAQNPSAGAKHATHLIILFTTASFSLHLPIYLSVSPSAGIGSNGNSCFQRPGGAFASSTAAFISKLSNLDAQWGRLSTLLAEAFGRYRLSVMAQFWSS